MTDRLDTLPGVLRITMDRGVAYIGVKEIECISRRDVGGTKILLISGRHYLFSFPLAADS